MFQMGGSTTTYTSLELQKKGPLSEKSEKFPRGAMKVLNSNRMKKVMGRPGKQWMLVVCLYRSTPIPVANDGWILGSPEPKSVS